MAIAFLPPVRDYALQAILATLLLVALIVAFVVAGRWFWRRRDLLVVRVRHGWQRVASDPRFAAFRARHAKLWSFAGARFAPGEYLGLHLTAGLAASIAALWLFAAVTEDVVHHDPLTELDLDVLTWFRAHATAALDRAGLAVSMIGSPAAMAVLAVVVGILLAVRRRWILLGGWLAVFVGGGILDSTLKIVIHRPRPVGAAAFLVGSSFSFPSGHAMGSLLGYGMLAYLLVRFWAPRWRLRVLIVTVATVLIVAIGLSRLYLGVHFFSDVVGGYAAGLVWLAACISGVEVALGQRGLLPWQVGVERRTRPRGTVTPEEQPPRR